MNAFSLVFLLLIFTASKQEFQETFEDFEECLKQFDLIVRQFS